MLWTSATVGHRDKRLESVALRFEELLAEAHAQDYANALWAMAKLGMSKKDGIARSIVERSLELLPSATMQDCCYLLHAAGRLGVSDRSACSMVL